MTFTTRRAALTALAGVPALALPALAAGAISTASPDHPDAEIFALIKRRGEVDKLFCAASQAADDLLWANVGPTRPPNDDFRDRFEAAEEHPDVVAAQDEKNALNTQWQELAGRLAETPAKTVDGMIAKLAMVALDMVYNEEDCLSGDYDGISASAALDAVRLRAAATA